MNIELELIDYKSLKERIFHGKGETFDWIVEYVCCCLCIWSLLVLSMIILEWIRMNLIIKGAFFFHCLRVFMWVYLRLRYLINQNFHCTVYFVDRRDLMKVLDNNHYKFCLHQWFVQYFPWWNQMTCHWRILWMMFCIFRMARPHVIMLLWLFWSFLLFVTIGAEGQNWASQGENWWSFYFWKWI